MKTGKCLMMILLVFGVVSVQASELDLRGVGLTEVLYSLNRSSKKLTLLSLEGETGSARFISENDLDQRSLSHLTYSAPLLYQIKFGRVGFSNQIILLGVGSTKQGFKAVPIASENLPPEAGLPIKILTMADVMIVFTQQKRAFMWKASGSFKDAKVMFTELQLPVQLRKEILESEMKTLSFSGGLGNMAMGLNGSGFNRSLGSKVWTFNGLTGEVYAREFFMGSIESVRNKGQQMTFTMRKNFFDKLTDQSEKTKDVCRTFQLKSCDSGFGGGF